MTKSIWYGMPTRTPLHLAPPELAACTSIITLCIPEMFMREVALLLVLLLLKPFETARAQDFNILPATVSSVPVPSTPGMVAASTKALDPLVLAHSAEGGRDREKGALYGLAIGALVGGVGFAAVNHAFTQSSPRDEYTLLSFLLGGAVGGAVGAAVGAIIGVPEWNTIKAQQPALRLIPAPFDGGALMVSGSFGFR